MHETRRQREHTRTKSIAKAMHVTETRIDEVRADLSALYASRDSLFEAPPIEWIEERLRNLREILERRVGHSALALKKLLGEIRLKPVHPDIGKPYYVAETAIDTFALLEDIPDGGGGGGSVSLRWWTLSAHFPRGNLILYLSDPSRPPPGRCFRFCLVRRE
jgi:hypothetical protein